jgi:hypothetical protein
MQCHDSPQRGPFHVVHRCMDGSSGRCARCECICVGRGVSRVVTSSHFLVFRCPELAAHLAWPSEVMARRSGRAVVAWCRDVWRMQDHRLPCQLGSQITGRVRKTDKRASFTDLQTYSGIRNWEWSRMRVICDARDGSEAVNVRRNPLVFAQAEFRT